METCWESGEFVLCRAHSDAEGLPVLVLAPVMERPAPEILHRMEHEYALREELDPVWAARPFRLVRRKGRTMLLLEDPGGKPLQRQLGRPMELQIFLGLAIAIAEALAQVHARGLIYKDLKPANILTDAGNGAVHLTGFGIASRLPREHRPPDPPETIAGTLPYMAPEQTGRMNRSVDSRADLYAFGVILYQMLTGVLPCTAGDPMEWVHCHVAREPVPPAGQVPGIPPQVSAIVMKLLAKVPEERYQTAFGVAADWRRCSDAWEKEGRIDPFPLGMHDASDRLRIPEKLYGREREVATLLEIFDRVVREGPPELVLVSGYSGIGKSAVVNELHKVLVPPRGLFAAGKFDQYKRDIPYATLAQAFQRLIRPLLGKSEAELDRWRDELRAALEPNGLLMVNLVPELKLIIGDQPPVPDLPPQDAERRFRMVFRRFVGVFARPEHPLALFLDDLQWLDAATLTLLADLATHPELRHLLLIGAYRDNEVDAAHPLMHSLDAVRQAGGAVHEIVLAPLAPGDIRRLVADALRCPRKRAEPLARLVYEKTGGNPFFTIQFLTALAEEQQLAFDPARGEWVWNLKRIRAKGYTDNVVDLMVGKLVRLPQETQDALKHFACLGNVVDSATLGLVLQLSPQAVHAVLWEAGRAGLVYRQEDGYTFLHDRVQEAAYALVPAESRKELHLKIGRLLLSRYAREARVQRLFDIVNQLNHGMDLITDVQEKVTLRRLNSEAGRKARRAVAYASARRYLAQAAALLPADPWDALYAESLDLHLELAECEYLVGNFQRSDELLALAVDKARSTLDRVRVYRLRQRLYQLSGRYREAMALGFEALRLLGVTLPESDEEIRVATEEELRQVPGNLRGRPIANLADEPMASDPSVRATIGLLAEMIPIVYVARPGIWPLITVKAVNLGLQHGHTEEAPFVYSCYTMVLVGVSRDIPSAFEFSEMTIRLNERFERAAVLRGKLLFHRAALVFIWRRHFATSLPLLDQAFLACLDAGDVVYAGYLTYNTVWLHWENGDALDSVIEVARRYQTFARQSRNEVVYNLLRIEEQFAASLQGAPRAPTDSSDPAFDEAGCVAAIERAGFRLGLAYYQIMKQIAAFLGERYEEALEYAARAAPMLLQVASMAIEATHHFYHALTLAALYPRSSAGEQQRFTQALQEILSKLKVWADHCPENFANRHALVAAEIARIEGRDLEAMRLYEQAIRSARDNGFIHNEALANELAARFYLARGFDKIAHAYLRDAHYGYLRWGALGKVRALEAAWPQLAEPERAGSADAIGAPVGQLDVMTVVKASQAVSGELALDQLAQTLMTIALEHAGAERGFLILPRGEDYRIEAEAADGRDKVRVILRRAPLTAAELPESVLRYVLRTRETVILDDAAAPNLFANDGYVRRARPRSVLCLPLVKQAELTGILYLENNLTPGAFTSGRVAVLELIASQAAISLENATLYADLQRENLERKRAEEAVRESQRLLQSIIDNSTAVIYLKDREGRYLFVNKRFEELFHITRATVAGCTDYDLFPPERADAFRALDERVLAAGTPTEAEEEVPHDERLHTYISLKTPICDREGRPYAICGISTDITERKQIDRMKDEFISTAAHELRTPLTTVMGYLELLLQRENAFSEEEQRGFLDQVYRNAEALARIINDLLDLSTVQAGRLITLRKSQENLADLVVRAVNAWQGLSDRHQFCCELAEAPENLCLDPGKIDQVLENLLSNAVKFSPDGGSIRVSGRRTDGEFEMTVEDDGIGMGPEQVARIFDKFYRADASDTAVGGLGLGMNIVRNIVEAHGGRIWVESERGRGTKVHFTLPMNRGSRECGHPFH